MANITIFAGGFGSGKSEIALNHALKKATLNKSIILADLDLVNPYFVSRQLKDILEPAGVRLLAPEGDLSFGDVPTMPREIIGLIQQDTYMVIDVAGDEVGCTVLGYLRKHILARSDYEFMLVLNPYRPFSRDLESVRLLKDRLECSSGLNFSGIISNPNLTTDSNIEIIKRGHEKIRGFSESLNIPIKCLTIEKEFYEELFPHYGSLLSAMELYLKPEWL